jgi:putative membrane protein
MHFYDGGWFWGMHVFWWLFWLVCIILFFGTLTPVPRHKVRETPRQILQRRYAAGEISSEEYEECKSKLDRDAGTDK